MSRLEASVEHNVGVRAEVAALADDRARLAEDRAALAARLDAAEARASRLAGASREVEARLVAVMEMVRRNQRNSGGGGGAP